jgi:hypothetical protein
VNERADGFKVPESHTRLLTGHAQQAAFHLVLAVQGMEGAAFDAIEALNITGPAKLRENAGGIASYSLCDRDSSPAGGPCHPFRKRRSMSFASVFGVLHQAIQRGVLHRVAPRVAVLK